MMNVTAHKNHYDSGKFLRALNDKIVHINWDKELLDAGDYTPPFTVLHTAIGLSVTVLLLILVIYCKIKKHNSNIPRRVARDESLSAKKFSVSKV